MQITGSGLSSAVNISVALSKLFVSKIFARWRLCSSPLVSIKLQPDTFLSDFIQLTVSLCKCVLNLFCFVVATRKFFLYLLPIRHH